MKLKDLPNELTTFVCEHVFEYMACAQSISRDGDGDVAIGCGCAFDIAKVIAFGFVKEAFPEVMDQNMLENGEYLERSTLMPPWVRGKE